ncbi:MAG TPA: glycosyltransferase family 39 protein [Bryobacteraceae bacterium]|nr:glycosyltransferase family 39 protein [Bryobacteraceae bacterium]
MRKRLRALATSLVLIVAVALFIRADFAWNYAHRQPRQALRVIPFLFESGNIAYSLDSGRGFASPFRVDTGPTAWMTPVYPLLLAGVFRVFGAYTFGAWVAAVALNILFIVLACVPIFYAAKRIAGVGVAALAGWLWAVFPNAILLPVESMWDACLAALLAATVLWATLALDGSRRWLGWCGYGLLWGLALMTTPTLASVLPLLLAWLAYRGWKHGRPWISKPAVALAIALACCIPWTVRNYRVFHAFIPLRSILGLQLWVGNNPEAREVWLGEQHPIHDSAERDRYVQMGEVAYVREKGRNALHFMFTHPGREAFLIGHRFLAFWSGGTPHPVRDFFASSSLWFRYVLLFNVLAAVGALAGIVILWRRRNPFFIPVGVMPVVIPFAYYLTLALPRYRLLIDPSALLLAAVTLWELANRGRRVAVPWGPARP